jgi:predicted permease
VAGQIALATVLLIAASLFVRTLGRAYSADPGFTARTGLLASFDLNSAGIEAARGPEFYTRALERLSALPEVASATITTAMPLAIGGSSDTSPAIEGYTPAPNEDVVVYYGMVAPNFFSTLGIPIVEGRAIDARDRDGQAPVVVINETMARRYWPGRSAVGGRLKTGPEWTTVVGVAKDGKYGALNEAPRAVMYYPIQQVYRAGGTLVVTTNGPAGPAVAAVRRSLAELAPDLALSDVRTIDEHLAGAFAMPRVGAILLGVFGGLALVLASVGLYGVVAFAVSQRTREIGVRLALGAHRGTILRQILGESAWTCGIGLAIGVALALAASPALKSQLVNLSPTDVVSYGATVALLLGVTLVATWLPARRAASVDPVTALRID